jgi:cell division protein FtsL
MAIVNNISRQSLKPQKSGLRWILIICIIFCQLLAYTWVRTESTQTMIRVSGAKENHAQKIAYYKALSVEKERLKSDERITRIAKTKLNLLTDTQDQTIYFFGEDS